MKKAKICGLALFGTVWLVLTVLAWSHPADEISDTERRKLAQFPELSVSSVLDGSFMADFEDYTLDQFPARDRFRQLKAQIHYDLLGQRDNNGIYIAQGYGAKLEKQLNEPSVRNALSKFNAIYDTYLRDTDSRICAVVIPDKSYYLAEENGYPAMDYEKLFEQMEQGMSWAQFVDITDLLSIEDYYRTDTHWRQEAILDVAQRLCGELEMSAPVEEEFTAENVARPFYGVYYGQAALPMAAETMTLMRSEKLDLCEVYQYETGKTTPVYDPDKLTGRDLYDVYLSGAVPLLTITNPSASTRRELIVFRDSFGSSLAPLLVSDYASVTLVDTRYISGAMLGNFLEFDGQDVLFAYSTLVLNESGTLK